MLPSSTLTYHWLFLLHWENYVRLTRFDHTMSISILFGPWWECAREEASFRKTGYKTRNKQNPPGDLKGLGFSSLKKTNSEEHTPMGLDICNNSRRRYCNDLSKAQHDMYTRSWRTSKQHHKLLMKTRKETHHAEVLHAGIRVTTRKGIGCLDATGQPRGCLVQPCSTVTASIFQLQLILKKCRNEV